jgi:DNA mismatch repair ATPase MutS
VAAWLDALGKIEALVSLARYAYEHPENTVPEFIEGAAAFAATELGHPLIPAAVRVRNDVEIAGAVRVFLVSGSNMSGKSTLLRTVGINTVLAMAGAPVCAKRLRLTPLWTGASIRINDSLHEGSSRFYAEITRLRQLFEQRPLPLLFLLDELLQGTNSADRRVGAEGVIRALVARRAIGLISTHDLALTDIAGLEPGTLVNVHFQDELVDGKLKFDFKLRPGIVTHSNGVALMRSIGLDV